MDERRFDALSRALSVAGSRRGALKTALAAFLGGAGVTVVTDDSDARPRLCRASGQYCTRHNQCCNGRCRVGKRYPRLSRNACECDAPDKWCGRWCTKVTTDEQNCGDCGIRCAADEQCCDGMCRKLGTRMNCLACDDQCGGGETCCASSGGCSDLKSDPDNCGACGNVCESGLCQNGVCYVPCQDVGTVANNCILTADSTEIYACYIEFAYAAGGSTCEADADCQTGCPDHHDCHCMTHLNSTVTTSDAPMCVAVNLPVNGTCCYPEAEQGASNRLYYCFVGVDGNQYQDGNDSEADDPVSGYMTCETTADCAASPDCQGLTSPETCICVTARNGGDGMVDGQIVALATPICHVIDPTP